MVSARNPSSKEQTMSATLPEISKKYEERILEGLKTGQEAVVATAGAWAKPIQQLVPSGPRLSLPKELPTTQETVDNAFAFSIRILEAQRSFAQDLLATASPVLKKLTGHVAAKSPVKSAG
jgi:hypothetical protein